MAKLGARGNKPTQSVDEATLWKITSGDQVLAAFELYTGKDPKIIVRQRHYILMVFLCEKLTFLAKRRNLLPKSRNL